MKKKQQRGLWHKQQGFGFSVVLFDLENHINLSNEAQTDKILSFKVNKCLFRCNQYPKLDSIYSL